MIRRLDLSAPDVELLLAQGAWADALARIVKLPTNRMCRGTGVRVHETLFTQIANYAGTCGESALVGAVIGSLASHESFDHDALERICGALCGIDRKLTRIEVDRFFEMAVRARSIICLDQLDRRGAVPSKASIERMQVITSSAQVKVHLAEEFLPKWTAAHLRQVLANAPRRRLRARAGHGL